MDLVISDMFAVCSFITSIAHYIFHSNTLHKAAYRLEILLLLVIFRSKLCNSSEHNLHEDDTQVTVYIAVTMCTLVVCRFA